MQRHVKTFLEVNLLNMNILDIVGATVTPIEDKEMLITIHPRFYGDPSKILYFPVYLDYWNLGIHVGDIPKDEKNYSIQRV